jgi:DNA invertase Pin-like site-specific DNA recombinase
METKNNTSVIYARVSSINDRQNTERQVIDLKAYANRSCLTLVKVYAEHVSGAKKNIDRPVLSDCLQYCKENRIGTLLVSELSRLGRNTFEVLATVRDLVESHINVYFQKEQMHLLDATGKPSLFTPILIATLSTCAEMERENIQYRLNSGRRVYIEKGGKLGRKKGSVKTREQKEEQYKDVLAYLNKGYKIVDVAKLTNTSTSTVQRLRSEFQIR